MKKFDISELNELAKLHTGLPSHRARRRLQDSETKMVLGSFCCLSPATLFSVEVAKRRQQIAAGVSLQTKRLPEGRSREAATATLPLPARTPQS
ncbi:hypothetical protein [Rosistilla oblonga]|uniref:hypothetical protein n=1 Tax=Rosistilla oblonga TaxID=2527990 RepID=UPI003A973DDC